MKKIKISIIPLLFLVLFLPWANANYFDSITINSADPAELGNLFQTNPCKISFVEFINYSNELNNIEFNFDDSSPIYCFGRISQYIVDDGNIKIYVGTNFFISLLLNLFLIFLFLRNITVKDSKISKINTKTLILASLLITLIVFSDRKFYNINFYLFDMTSFNTYLYLFCFLFLALTLFNESIFLKNNNFINYLPFLFLFSKNITDTNLSVFLIYFLLIGIQSKRNSKLISIIRKTYIFGVIFWSINARIPYIDYPINYLGFTSTSYDFYSILIYSAVFYFFIKGVTDFNTYSFNKISLNKFVTNLYIVFFIKIFIYFLGMYTNLYYFIFSYYFETTSVVNDMNHFLIKNIDFLVLLLFFSIINLHNREKHKNIYFLRIFYLGLTLISTPKILEIFKDHYFVNNFKFFKFHNPTFLEFLVGSGPMNFNQFNFELNSKFNFTGFSSFNSLLLFFGIIGITIFLTYFIFLLIKNFNFSYVFLLKLLFITYLFLSEVINNISSLINFYILFFVLFGNKSKSNFLEKIE